MLLLFRELNISNFFSRHPSPSFISNDLLHMPLPHLHCYIFVEMIEIVSLFFHIIIKITKFNILINYFNKFLFV